MTIPVLTEMVAACAICDEVACERDLVYVEAGDDVDAPVGSVVCRECCPEEP